MAAGSANSLGNAYWFGSGTISQWLFDRFVLVLACVALFYVTVGCSLNHEQG